MMRFVPVDSRTRFSAAADDYRRWRPDYPLALFDWLEAETNVRPPAPVADLGCGTGISTRQLAERGYRVTGVDPNPDMLAMAREDGGAEYVRGEATATGLADGSVQLVTAAQAFHWFDVPAVMAELGRILGPAGWAAAFWNERTGSPFLREYDALLEKHSREYRQLIATPTEVLRSIASEESVRDYRTSTFEHGQRFDREGLLGRARSSSYVVHGIDDLATFESELLAAFDRHAVAGRVEFPYTTIVGAWQVER